MALADHPQAAHQAAVVTLKKEIIFHGFCIIFLSFYFERAQSNIVETTNADLGIPHSGAVDPAR